MSEFIKLVVYVCKTDNVIIVARSACLSHLQYWCMKSKIHVHKRMTTSSPVTARYRILDTRDIMNDEEFINASLDLMS